MAGSVSVVIAALNAAHCIAAAVDSAFAAGANEVIVSDGGSTDATRDIAGSRGAEVMTSPPMRARQFNAGARRARNDAIIFLHADTTLTAGACQAVAHALGRFEFGGFRIAFAERALKLRVAASLINLRTRFTRCPWGDQGQFIRRETFLRDGGFREIPLMEDYELAVRMKRRSVVLPITVITSGRRFLEKGVLRTAFINWSIVARWRTGADVERLAKMYRS
ncbi:MAG: TIGR04283 family arsenosugar biosynthesis glycosyltransferase [Thermoanaerobaculia bacterium]